MVILRLKKYIAWTFTVDDCKIEDKDGEIKTKNYAEWG